MRNVKANILAMPMTVTSGGRSEHQDPDVKSGQNEEVLV